jgi:hypothetical protein
MSLFCKDRCNEKIVEPILNKHEDIEDIDIVVFVPAFSRFYNRE